MKIKVIFGSKSDSKVFESVNAALEKQKADYDFNICSAHRQPEQLAEILREKHDLIIAGAGLAAHLPGVIASKTTKPVIGVPCSGNFDGIDALLSIFQMPPGIPVLGVGVDNAEEAAKNAIKMTDRSIKKLNIMTDDLSGKLKEKAMKMIQEFELDTSFSDELIEDAINIRCVPLNKAKKENSAIIINVPVHENETAEDAVKMLAVSKEGLWVGLNRIDNAVVAAAEIMNNDNLNNFRKKMR